MEEVLERPMSSELVDKKTVIVMIGLPATGKSYISKMLHRYLNWKGFKTSVFNAGDYRRVGGHTGESSSFFDPSNKEAMALRTKYAMMALDALFEFLESGGDVGLFDATNSNVERRSYIASRCAEAGFRVLFLESVCNDEELIRKNCEMKLNSPDYRNRSREEALEDFQMRLENYKKNYQPLDRTRDRSQSYIRLFNVGEYIIANHCNGVLESDVVSYLLNTHLVPRKIWLCVHGETNFTLKGILGGDPPLNENGMRFSEALYQFIHNQNSRSITIMCDKSLRVVQTVHPLAKEFNVEYCNLLRELNGGDYSRMTYEEIRRHFPDEYAKRERNKLEYRYPDGESYIDVKERLNQVLMKIVGCRDSVLIVGHVAVIRIIMAYFVDKPIESIPDMEVKMHTVYELDPTAYCHDAKVIKLL
ncbi:6-phosphofructo-2-kinase [Blastocystis sp. subtype 4]|uniref:6-phosphofructo-2-kinase n=1 Tax=Blastocystis sp. subtype 4 TaxID=944170 RepID=UPI0007120392|nr:6-phosphofructo-2-kinase [Blastocystis sp. subtype 4]KNB43540.1 6-phosphofructo-2-kinase [Blastocystis sp. subtype 4]|eukprot:XP_014526983.1 6-phosphofructo-2-kinase [Blastocystis sp. subtype 4]